MRWNHTIAPIVGSCTVKVVNHNFRDVEVFVLSGSTRTRLERVLAGDIVRLEVPLDVGGDRPRLLLRQVGSGMQFFATNNAYCESGQEMELWIASHLHQSTLVNW